MAYKPHNENLCLRCRLYVGGVCMKNKFDYCKITKSTITQHNDTDKH